MESRGWTIKGTFNALLEGELSCLLTDLVIMSKSIVIADNENKKIKRFSSEGEFIDMILLDDPCGVTALDNSSHVVVTEPLHKLISFISITETVQLSSRRKTTKKYQSVCCVDDSRLAVGCCELRNGSVDIIDYMGLVLVTTQSSLSENTIFRTPASIACLQNKCILVSDSGLGKVIGIGIDGNVEFTYDPECIPAGICCDKVDTIYLCNYDRHIVQCLRYENKNLVRTHFNFYMDRPIAIAFSRKCLFLTSEMPSGIVSIIDINDLESETDMPIQLCNIHVSISHKHEDNIQN